MSGYTRREVEARELTRLKLTPPEWIEESERQLRILGENGRIEPYEKEYIQRDGSRKWMLFAGRRIEPDLLTEYCIDVSEQKRVERERKLLSDELSHRVKNTLAVVKALAVQTGGKTIEEFRESFIGRLGALVTAHDLLLGANWQDTNLKVLVENSLKAYQSEGRINVEGSGLTISPRQALGLSLVIHELATNALKYGALSNGEGQIQLSWTNGDAGENGGMVNLVWQERGGPQIKPPAHRGLGLTLIERVSDLELEGEANLAFQAKGLRCSVDFPRNGG